MFIPFATYQLAILLFHGPPMALALDRYYRADR